MSIHKYEALQSSALTGDTKAIAEIIRIAMRQCECDEACFFARRASEFLSTIGIQVAA